MWRLSWDNFSMICLEEVVFKLGYRNRTSGSLVNVSSNGNYWSSSINSSINSYNLNFNSGNVNPLNNNNRANGFAISHYE